MSRRRDREDQRNNDSHISAVVANVDDESIEEDVADKSLTKRMAIRECKETVIYTINGAIYTLADLLWVLDAEEKVKTHAVRDWYSPKLAGIRAGYFKRFRIPRAYSFADVPFLYMTVHQTMETIELLTWKILAGRLIAPGETKNDPAWRAEARLLFGIVRIRAQVLAVIRNKKEAVDDTKRYGLEFDPVPGDRREINYGVNATFVFDASNWLDEIEREFVRYDEVFSKTPRAPPLDEKAAAEVRARVFKKFTAVLDEGVLIDMFKGYTCDAAVTGADFRIHNRKTRFPATSGVEVLFTKNVGAFKLDDAFSSETAVSQDASLGAKAHAAMKRDVESIKNRRNVFSGALQDVIARDPTGFYDFLFEYAYVQRSGKKLKYERSRLTRDVLIGGVLYPSLSDYMMREREIMVELL